MLRFLIVMLNVVMLSVIMLSVIMLNVVILSVVAPKNNDGDCNNKTDYQKGISANLKIP